MNFSTRTAQLDSAIFLELNRKKNQLRAAGRDAFDFSIGTPDLPPPPHVVEVLIKEAANPEHYKYAIRDLPELIEAVIAWYHRRFQVTLSPEEVTSLRGSQDGLSHIALTLINPGDLALVPDPGYPIFSIGPLLAGATPYPLPLLKENNYLIDFERIPATVAHQAKLMIVSYPNNPVTAVAPPEFYEKLVWFATKYQIAVIHDNAYCELFFEGARGGSFLSIPGAKKIGVEFNSLSKSYNLTGCRLAFALGNQALIKQFQTLKSHLDYGIFLPLQKAAITAITGPQDSIGQTVAAYRSRRDLLITGLARLGWPIDPPSATMFVWAPVPAGHGSAMEFTLELIEKTGVLVVPGSSFGKQGEGFVRFALVQREETISRAIQAIAAADILSS